MRAAFVIAAGLCLAAATASAAGDYPPYCGQQWPRLFAASLCGHVEPAGGAAVGRSVGTFMRGSSRSMQKGGIANPTWIELSTDQAGSWRHTDGHDYVIIEDVQVEQLQNNWFTFEDWPGAFCVTATCVREASTWGPGGQAMRVNFTAAAGQFFDVGTNTGLVQGDWLTACAYAWVESGTLDAAIQGRIGGAAPNDTQTSNITLTTTPTEHCLRMQWDDAEDPGSSGAVYAKVIEDPNGDGTGVDFLVGYLSAIVNSVQSSPIKNNVATTSNATHAQREADVLPFSTADLSVEKGKGHADVAWFNYAYDEPATPASKAIVGLSESSAWRVFYYRPNASTNVIQYDAGGQSVSHTVTFNRGDVTRVAWRWRSGEPIELCVDGTCKLSTGNYTPPAAFDANGCWGCRRPDATPFKFLDAGLRNARIQ